MKKFRKIFALSAAVFLCCSCAEKVPEENQYSEIVVSEVPATTEFVEDETFDINGQYITWLADYDLNPAENCGRSVALSIFEDVYGAKVNFVHTTVENKYEKLAEMLDCGDEVDMFPYDETAFPNGVLNDFFQPLDDYFTIMEVDESLWENMNCVIDMFEYNNQHYVIPYSVSNPVVITYSRKLIDEEELDDPYELYLNDQWNWDTMLQLMRDFVDNHTGKTKYGINGYFGQALVKSSGSNIVNYADGKFSNNLNDANIQKAGKFMQSLAEMNLVDNNYIGHYPKDNSTLFFAMGSWALGESNALNPDNDLMIVPFPKSPDADSNYISCDFNARMFVKNSTKGDAVATYIKCERIAASQEEYKSAMKELALTEKKSASGNYRYFVTEEQYDALQSYIETGVPVFDFAYGMGESMNCEGDYNYSTRGVVNNLETSVISGYVTSWKDFCNDCSETIDNAVEEFNK